MTPLSIGTPRMSNRFKDITYAFFILLVACSFAYRTFGHTTGSSVMAHSENLRAAYHLVHTGWEQITLRRTNPKRRASTFRPLATQ
jgi:hypothetical protein